MIDAKALDDLGGKETGRKSATKNLFEFGVETADAEVVEVEADWVSGTFDRQLVGASELEFCVCCELDMAGDFAGALLEDLGQELKVLHGEQVNGTIIIHVPILPITEDLAVKKVVMLSEGRRIQLL